MAKAQKLPAKDTPLFFEGHEYHFAESRKPGHLTFVRPDKSNAPHRSVTIFAEEFGKTRGKLLVEPLQAELGDWIARSQHASDKERRTFVGKAARYANEAQAKLALETRELAHVVVDGQPVRLMAPPLEMPSLKVPKQGAQARIRLGGSSVTQSEKKGD